MRAILALLLFGWLASATLAAQVDYLPVAVEQAASPEGPWSATPLGQQHVMTDGTLLLPAQQEHEYWRLRISPAGQIGFALGLPLLQAPPEATRIAQEFLDLHAAVGDPSVADPTVGDPSVGDPSHDRVGDPFESWRRVKLADIVTPVYDITVDGARTPAFLEFKVVADDALPAIEDGARATPAPTGKDCGFILVSLTENESPIVCWGTQGATMVEQLRQRARTPRIKPLLFGVDLMIGETPEGQMAATLGSLLHKPNPALLELQDWLGWSIQDDETGVSNSVPELPIQEPFQSYDSYQALKDDYATNEFFQIARARKRESARLNWLLARETRPQTLTVGVGEASLLFAGREVIEAVLRTPDDERVATVTALGIEGLRLEGLAPGGGVLRIQFSGEESFFFVQVLDSVPEAGEGGSGGGSFTPGWRLHRIDRAGTTQDQRWYQQYQSLAFGGGGPGNYVGCGSCAWTMLMGWWDRKGVPVIFRPRYHGSGVHNWQLGLEDAPGANTYHVEKMMYDFRHQWVDPNFCDIFSGSCGTPPDKMAEGIDYFAALRSAYNLLYTPLLQKQLLGYAYYVYWSYFPKNGVNEFNKMARESIQKGYPSIIGVGNLQHYAVAYGYYEWRFELAPGYFPWSQAWFQCNWGDGGGEGPKFYNFSDNHFFATKTRFWQTETQYELP